MLNTAMTFLGVTAENTVYIGDTEIDLLTAKNSSLPCLFVTWGFRSEAYLRSLGASWFANDANDMCKALLGVPRS